MKNQKYLSFLKSMVLMMGLAFAMSQVQKTMAQTGHASQVYQWTDLRGTSWSDQYNNQYKQWTLTFTDSVMTEAMYFSHSGNIHTRSRLFYLANSIPQTFDKSKVGKKTSGRYIIGLFDNRVVYNEILGLTQDELKIRQTYYGDTLVFRRRQ